jgi:tRNA(fMet)-specific endonuclease VapC
MKYLLDSNICIHFFRGKFNVFEKLNEVGIENCAISEITLPEYHFKIEGTRRKQRFHCHRNE